MRDPESEYLDLDPGEAFDQLVGASIHYRIAIGPNAGKKALMPRTVAAQPQPPSRERLRSNQRSPPRDTRQAPVENDCLALRCGRHMSIRRCARPFRGFSVSRAHRHILNRLITRL